VLVLEVVELHLECGHVLLPIERRRKSRATGRR
jgi:hypothetical protein